MNTPDNKPKEDGEWWENPPYEYDEECRSHNIPAIIAEAEKRVTRVALDEVLEVIQVFRKQGMHLSDGATHSRLAALDWLEKQIKESLMK